MIPGAKPIITSCFLFSFVWQWTDSFYSSMFLKSLKLISTKLSGIVDAFGIYLSNMNGGTTLAPQGYANAILSTGVLLAIIPLLILYVFCQRLFVESLASTGVKQ